MIGKNLAPICLFVYNRLDETKQTIEALKKNYLAKESELFIFSDGAKNEKAIQEVEEVRTYLKTIKDFKLIKIFKSKDNKGLANSIISGVSKVIKEYGKVIVLEDDLLTVPNFLTFMNEALLFYKNQSKIQTINGYSVHIETKNDVYFQRRPFSWGWATWNEYWNKELFDKQDIKKQLESNPNILKELKFKLGADIPNMLLDSIENINDSWYVRWAYDHFKNNKLSVYPSRSLIENIGFIEESTHCQGINTYVSELENNYVKKIKLRQAQLLELEENYFLNYFSKLYKIIFRLKLLRNKHGRRLLINEIKNRI